MDYDADSVAERLRQTRNDTLRPISPEWRKCVRFYEVPAAAMGLPPGTRLFDAATNEPLDAVTVRAEHGSFGHVAEGELIPTVRLMGRRRYVVKFDAGDWPRGLRVVWCDVRDDDISLTVEAPSFETTTGDEPTFFEAFHRYGPKRKWWQSGIGRDDALDRAKWLGFAVGLSMCVALAAALALAKWGIG